MSTDNEQNGATPLTGKLLHLGERRRIAIYLREGTTWVADFNGCDAEISTPGVWFAANRNSLTSFRRAVETAAPLAEDVVEQIERLHRELDGPVLPRTPVAQADGLLAAVSAIALQLFGRRQANPLDSTA